MDVVIAGGVSLLIAAVMIGAVLWLVIRSVPTPAQRANELEIVRKKVEKVVSGRGLSLENLSTEPNPDYRARSPTIYVAETRNPFGNHQKIYFVTNAADCIANLEYIDIN